MTDMFRRRAVALLASACVVGVAHSAGAGQRAGRSSDRTDFVADVVVEGIAVDRHDQVVQRMPTVRYRITLGQGGRTELLFHDTPPFPGRGPLTDPTAGHRAVLNGRDGFRVFDAAGRAVAAVPAGEISVPAAPDAALVGPRAGSARRAALVARFGAPLGRHRNRERFVRSDGDAMEEVLTDPETALPVEVNVMRAGRLASRSTFEYRTLADGRIFRASQRDEVLSATDDEDGSRTITVTTYTPVTGGGR